MFGTITHTPAAARRQDWQQPAVVRTPETGRTEACVDVPLEKDI